MTEIIPFIGNGKDESEGSSENSCRIGHSGSGDFSGCVPVLPGVDFRSQRPNLRGQRWRPKSAMTVSN